MPHGKNKGEDYISLQATEPKPPPQFTPMCESEFEWKLSTGIGRGQGFPAGIPGDIT